MYKDDYVTVLIVMLALNCQNVASFLFVDTLPYQGLRANSILLFTHAFGLVWFYGTSNIEAYFMPNLFYT